MKKLVFLCCIGSMLACNRGTGDHRDDTKMPYYVVDSVEVPAPKPAEVISPNVDSKVYPRIFAGTLPCADCSGIRTTLHFTGNYDKFILFEEYLGRENSARKTEGLVNTERGYIKDRNATLFILNYDKPAAQRYYFVRESGKDRQLLKLDNHRRKLPGSEKYILKGIK